MQETLNAAYGEGLLSHHTLLLRLDVLFGHELVDAEGLVGDLTLRAPPTRLAQARARAAALVQRALGEAPPPPPLLALDWTGAREELLLGRHIACDVVLDHPSVSRRHARLSFRDGHWVLRDLDSTNGTRINGRHVVRCRLEAGDRLRLGSAELLVD
jgi:FHA domain-containing protein